MALEIVIVPCRQDNYAYLLRDDASRRVGVIDAPEAASDRGGAGRRGWDLNMILITHHHDDHIAGVDQLRDIYGATVVGAAADRHRLPVLDIAVEDGDSISLGGSTAEVIDVPGHTIGHIAYYFAEAGALFSADSLMVMGCGRLFEGTAAQMWSSLARMAALPGETLVYSGHEYTQSQCPLRAVDRRREPRPGGPRRRNRRHARERGSRRCRRGSIKRSRPIPFCAPPTRP